MRSRPDSSRHRLSSGHGEQTCLAVGPLPLIDIEEDTSGYNIPGGAAAQVAVYTPYAHHFALIREDSLRMRSWENFVFLEGHGGGGGSEGGH